MSSAWSSQAKRFAVGAHRLLLVGKNAQVRAREGAAQQYEARLFILHVNAAGLRLIHLSFQQFAGTGGAPSLQAHIGEIEAGGDGGVEQVLVVGHVERGFTAVGDDGYVVRRHFKGPSIAQWSGSERAMVRSDRIHAVAAWPDRMNAVTTNPSIDEGQPTR